MRNVSIRQVAGCARVQNAKENHRHNSSESRGKHEIRIRFVCHANSKYVDELKSC